jgi:hypothetical protein
LKCRFSLRPRAPVLVLYQIDAAILTHHVSVIGINLIVVKAGTAESFHSTDSLSKWRFRKVADPRRHRFTREECSKGFWQAIESIISRHPEKVTRDGRQIVCGFLKSVGKKRAQASSYYAAIVYRSL